MTNYAITTYTVRGDYDSVAAALETKLETVDATKTIYLHTIISRGNEFVGILQYAT